MVLVAGAIALTTALHGVGVLLWRHAAKRKGSVLADAIFRRARRPSRAILILAGLMLVMLRIGLPAKALDAFEHIASLVLIASVAWLVIALMNVIDDVTAARFPTDQRDNLHARKIRTHVQVMKRLGATVVIMLAVAIMLMTFSEIRQIGTSLLASAGLAGLVVGIAARSSITNLIAGLQMAFTEPIRLDDVVIVEGEWGRIEEITPTYVVVCIWDLRRLIVPLSYFIEKPFENWTRVTADLLGTVVVYADYSIPVQAVREELHRILQGTKLWDGKAWGLQVTNADQRTLELRGLMSAPDSSTAWDLRCLVREKLVAFMQERYPEALPRARVELKRNQG
ncbi:MAG TPA: mechanosensitive ion channel domain-containing protein [Candidatus Sulfotelmatobacter sp.]|nr:mechanosensitive ion channel domain-containing protein [Candidatus Sulfotelmatobacter sp.]